MFRIICTDGQTEAVVGEFPTYAEADAALDEHDDGLCDLFILNERGEGFGPLGGAE